MSAVGAPGGGHAALMDGVYRRQRHLYDATRRYYLLGRDRMIADLAPPPGGTVLELGCGTGRNLIHAAGAYPHARLYGLDISAAMLSTAAAAIRRRGLGHRIALVEGDAARFDAAALFAQPAFDRIYVSYALSMIPDWPGTIAAALAALKPEGSLHVVDFGLQERLPGWCGDALRAWLARFHVTPRAELPWELARQARSDGRPLAFDALYGGYAWLARIGPRS